VNSPEERQGERKVNFSNAKKSGFHGVPAR
jgi:hypothetical protein